MDILYIKNDENVNHCQLSWIYCILKMMKMWIIVNYHGYTVYSKWWKCESLSIIMDILYIKNDENVNHCQLSWIYCILKMMKMWIIVNYHGYTVYSKWWKRESLSIIMDILYIQNDENVNHCQLSWIYCIFKMMKMWIIVNYHGYTVYSKWWKCESLWIIMDIFGCTTTWSSAMVIFSSNSSWLVPWFPPCSQHGVIQPFAKHSIGRSNPWMRGKLEN